MIGDDKVLNQSQRAQADQVFHLGRTTKESQGEPMTMPLTKEGARSSHVATR